MDDFRFLKIGFFFRSNTSFTPFTNDLEKNKLIKDYGNERGKNMKIKAAQVFRNAGRLLIYPGWATQLKIIGVTSQWKEAEDGSDPVSAQ